GMCIGVLIGLVKVALKEAWLTVLDGYRPGRQLILAEASAMLGRAEYVTLPFMGRNDVNEVDPEHARIVRQSDGRFILEDNDSRSGVRVNNVRVNDRVILNDGDIIKLGMNLVRFNQRHRHDPVQEVLKAQARPSARPEAIGGTGPWEATWRPAPEP